MLGSYNNETEESADCMLNVSKTMGRRFILHGLNVLQRNTAAAVLRNMTSGDQQRPSKYFNHALSSHRKTYVRIQRKPRIHRPSQEMQESGRRFVISSTRLKSPVVRSKRNTPPNQAHLWCTEELFHTKVPRERCTQNPDNRGPLRLSVTNALSV